MKRNLERAGLGEWLKRIDSTESLCISDVVDGKQFNIPDKFKQKMIKGTRGRNMGYNKDCQNFDNNRIKGDDEANIIEEMTYDLWKDRIFAYLG